MLSDAMKRIIEAACVTVSSQQEENEEPLQGRGALIPGNLILTAAHCIAHDLAGRMALGDVFVHEIHTSHGMLRVQPVAVEPVSDIAVLGVLDAQTFCEDAEAFEAWCEATTPVPLCLDDFPLFEPFPVALYTHLRQWVQGTAQQCHADAETLWMDIPEGIRGGTSGSPLVTDDGAIVGVVSNCGGPGSAAIESGTEGLAPRPHLTVPVWVMQHIQRHTSQG